MVPGRLSLLYRTAVEQKETTSREHYSCWHRITNLPTRVFLPQCHTLHENTCCEGPAPSARSPLTSRSQLQLCIESSASQLACDGTGDSNGTSCFAIQPPLTSSLPPDRIRAQSSRWRPAQEVDVASDGVFAEGSGSRLQSEPHETCFESLLDLCTTSLPLPPTPPPTDASPSCRPGLPARSRCSSSSWAAC